MIPKRVLFLAPRAARIQSSSSTSCILNRRILQTTYNSQCQRSYATPGRPKTAVGETNSVKRRPAAAKNSTTTRTTAVRTTKAKTTKAKAAKPKVKKTKKVVAKKPAKKVLTEEQKAKQAKKKELEKVRALKAAALDPPSAKPQNTWATYVAENPRKGERGPTTLNELSTAFKALSTSEIEHYQQISQNRNKERVAAFQSWIESHSPKVIKEANTARRALQRLDQAKGKKASTRWQTIKDPRLPKPPVTGYLAYVNQIYKTGSHDDLSFGEKAKRAASEWRNMSEAEKQPYNAGYEEAHKKYVAERDALLS